MNAKTLARVNRFGKVGKIVMTVLMIVAILAALLCGLSAIYAATFPSDAVRVTVTNHAEFKIDKNSFSDVWGMLADSYTGATGENPGGILAGGDNEMLPAENTELQTELNFFHQSYSSAIVRSEGSKKIVDATSSPTEYSSSNLVMLFVFAMLVAVSIVVALWMLRRLFTVLSICESPFCADFVMELRAFGYSLLPVALLTSIGETLAVRFLSAGNVAGVSIQWGFLIAFAVTMCLVTVFRYGVQLQKESDETL